MDGVICPACLVTEARGCGGGRVTPLTDGMDGIICPKGLVTEAWRGWEGYPIN